MKGLDTGFTLSAAQKAMIDEFTTYLDDRFPREREALLNATPEWAADDDVAFFRDFTAQLARDGWLVPHWPERYGGRGLTIIDQMLIREELAYRRIPITNANGLDMLAPILLLFGTEAQKDEHLPRIARQERRWCQGYSEPDAGSDLTSLRTTAVRDGDHFVVNGSKVWTGHAMDADWMFLLARTDLDAKGSKGLSLLMLSLQDTPGVSVHPIRSLTGGVTFCQEYFTDARVPIGNLVGPENDGWRVSRALLEHERADLSRAARHRRVLDDLLDVVATRGTDEFTLVRLGRLIEKVEAARSMAYQVAMAKSDVAGDFPPHMPSVLRLYGATLGVELAEAAVDILGLDIADDQPEWGVWSFWEEFLYSTSLRIAGGTSEIQREVIASRALSLART